MITIRSKEKESLWNATRRAIKNAEANNKIVSLVFEGISCMVYPRDNANKILRWITREKLVQEIARLQNLVVA